MSKHSELNPSDSMIRYTLNRKRTFSRVLVALSEEPCYTTELCARLGLKRETVNSAVLYLANVGLVYKVSNSDDEKVANFIRAKTQRFIQSLNPKLASNVIKRVKFYFITERGKEFLEHAKKSLYGDS